jgi:hypothetical protein
MAVYDVTALSTPLEFDTANSSCKSAGKIPGSDRIIMAWFRSTDYVAVQCFDVHPSTGAVTAIGSPVDIEVSSGGPLDTGLNLVVIDANNAIVAWPGSGADGYVRLVSIDSSGNVTTNGSALEYDTAQGYVPFMTLWDSTHVLIVWDGSAFDGFAQILEINTGSGTITKLGSALEFDTSSLYSPIVLKLNATKAFVAYIGPSNHGKSIVLNINTSTWAVSAAGSAFVFRSAGGGGLSATIVEDLGSTIKIAVSFNMPSVLEVFSLIINTSTWSISTQNTVNLITHSGSTGFESSLVKVDDETLLVFNRGTDADGFATTFSYTTSSGIGSVINSLEFYTTDVTFLTNPPVEMTQGRYVLGWAGDGNDGYVQTFDVDLGSIPPTPSTNNALFSFAGL